MTKRPTLLACIFVVAASGLAGLATAQAETISAMQDDDNKSIAYTPCQPGEDAAECLIYAISCRPNEVFGSGLELTVIGQGGGDKPDILSIARSLLDKPYGEKRLAFTIGGKTVEITVSAVVVSANELNGDWDVSVRSMDEGAFYDALSDKTAASVKSNLAGYPVMLASTKADGQKLMKFKKACTN